MKSASIVLEDEQILVVDKKAGVVVNRSETIKEPTLQDELEKYLIEKGSDPAIGGRAGIVHRLDRETSGLLLVAKTQDAFDKLQSQFKNRLVQKEYIALVHGKFKEESGTIEGNIARVGRFGKFGIGSEGRESETKYRVEAGYRLKDEVISSKLQVMNKPRLRYLQSHATDYSLVRLFPKTGRTHQIRVHLKSLGHPIVSDLIYDPAKLLKFDLSWCPRLFLHAEKITFDHPATGQKMNFESNLPEDLTNALQLLEIRDYGSSIFSH